MTASEASARIIRPLPESAYLPGHTPRLDESGHVLHDSALAITYKYAQEIWNKRNGIINERIKDRSNAQIVVLPAHKDTSQKLLKSLKEKKIGEYPVATYSERSFPDGDRNVSFPEINPNADSVYIVGSLLSSDDFNRARCVANYCKEQNPNCVVTMVCNSIGKARQDKNVNPKTEEFVPDSLNIEVEMKACSKFFDRMMVVEPHSSATQAFAAESDMPLLPISPWKVLVDHLLKEGVRDPKSPKKRIRLTKKNAVIVRPDEGRSIAARRIQEYTDFESVSFIKKRNGDDNTEVAELHIIDQARVRGKFALLYDDEAATLSTVETIGNKLQKYGMLAFALMIAYGKFVPGKWSWGKGKLLPERAKGWEERIKHKLLSTIIQSDAREPIGKINKVEKIETISLDTMLRDFIEADIKGVDFWQDPQFKDLILQEE